MRIMAPGEEEARRRSGGHSGRKYLNPEHEDLVNNILRITRS